MGRNDPCPCGSGKRFKACCGRLSKDALPELEAAVRRLPGDAVAHLNLGNVLGRRGRLQEAANSFVRALQLRPEFAEAHNNLGDLNLELARFDEAAANCRRAIEISSEAGILATEVGDSYLQAICAHNTGSALLRLGEIHQAEISLIFLTTKTRAVNHEHAGLVQQIENEALIRSSL